MILTIQNVLNMLNFVEKYVIIKIAVAFDVQNLIILFSSLYKNISGEVKYGKIRYFS